MGERSSEKREKVAEKARGAAGSSVLLCLSFLLEQWFPNFYNPIPLQTFNLQLCSPSRTSVSTVSNVVFLPSL